MRRISAHDGVSLLLDTRLQYLYLVVLPSALWLWPAALEPKFSSVVHYYVMPMSLLVLSAMFLAELRRARRLRRLREMCPHDEHPFYLLVRSFDHSQAYQTFGTVVSSDASATPHVESVVGDIDRAVRRHGAKLVVLGGELVVPSNHEIIWLRGEDVEWLRNFEILAANAKGIIVFPETSMGVLEELTRIRSMGLIDKLIFVMPPMPPEWSGLIHYADVDEKRTRWEQTRQRLHEAGYTIPAFDSDGLVFTLAAEARVHAVPIDPEQGAGKSILNRLLGTRSQPIDYVAAIEPFLRGAGAESAPFNDVYPRLRLLRHDPRTVSLLTVTGSDGGFLFVLIASTLPCALLTAAAIHIAIPIALAAGWLAYLAILRIRSAMARRATAS